MKFFSKKGPTAHVLLAVLVLALVGAADVSAKKKGGTKGPKPLRLRVNAAIGAAGGSTVLVFETYAPRSVGSGQLCIQTRKRAAGNLVFNSALSVATGQPNLVRTAPSQASVFGSAAKFASLSSESPFAVLERNQVFSTAGDAVSTAVIEQTADSQLVMINFSSASGTINNVEGPLGAVTLRLADALAPGEEFTLEIDLANTFLFDPDGNEIPVEPRQGDLTIRGQGVPFRVEMEGDKIEAGELAEIGIATSEPFPLARGRIAIRYDSNVATVVGARMDERHGDRATFSLDVSMPGFAIVEFSSPEGTLNLVPGEILMLDVITRLGVPPGTRSPLTFDPSLTFFEGPDGEILGVDLKDDVMRFE